MATIPIARRVPAQRSTASEHRVLRRKARVLRVLTKHASPSTMTMKKKPLQKSKQHGNNTERPRSTGWNSVRFAASGVTSSDNKGQGLSLRGLGWLGF